MTNQTNLPRKTFVNLAVRDVTRSKEFFTKLGFELNAQFTTDDTACLIINEHACVMLLAEARFQAFTTKGLCDTARHTEAINALSAASREDVQATLQKALAAGGTAAMPPQDHGFMYGASFYDLDGHHWEVIWMDSAALQG